MTQHETPQALLSALTRAWDAGDADAYAACFTPEATYVSFDGDSFVGREAIAESHRSLFAKWLKGSRLTLLDTREVQIANGVVVSHVRGAVLKKNQSAPSRSRLSTGIFVLVRRDGWRVVAFQNTRYRPFAETLLGRILTAWS